MPVLIIGAWITDAPARGKHRGGNRPGCFHRGRLPTFNFTSRRLDYRAMESINKPLLWFRAAGGIVAVLAIGLLLHRLHPGALAEALHHTRPGWVLVATVLYGLLFLPAAWRWHLALRLSRSEVNFGVTARVSLIGHFFYTIFFGAAGG